MHVGGELYEIMNPPGGDVEVPIPGFSSATALNGWIVEQPRQPTIGRLLVYLGEGTWAQQYLAMYLLRMVGVACNWSNDPPTPDNDAFARTGYWTVTIDDGEPMVVRPDSA